MGPLAADNELALPVDNSWIRRSMLSGFRKSLGSLDCLFTFFIEFAWAFATALSAFIRVPTLNESVNALLGYMVSHTVLLPEIRFVDNNE